MRLLLVDDHTLLRVALGDMLSQHGYQVEHAGTEIEALSALAKSPPDVVLLDLRMPGSGGLEVLKRIRSRDSELPVVMLTSSDEERDLLQALQAGANGYLVKDAEPAELIQGLEKVLAGQTAVASRLTDTLVQMMAGGRSQREGAEASRPPDPFAALTPREREILMHVARAESNKVIARELGVSDGTVKLHIKSILRKLGVKSRVEAAVKAVDLGLTRREKG
ncbi:response regulator [Alkalilimnicola ehrlichii MLHE-1]|uniref:Two component transcriptional regulator, LuxR family n=1 Tax=Alkalilimnicola ehrlichii (strain ATCC BAA-1101 / DSM 17681 / MLHE-1) TaxID=187272 RepID=Q0A822_ALKEH|nr:response regulator transcription factor [Alkalilimnicola ehrlichii]ABI57015.1 two component transcriptional regulator, LuxR family [Alkalilimnicola ehrlichii MLHE-1]